MERVGQFKRVWLNGTETAIHNHVISLREFDRIAFADSLAPGMRYEYPVLTPPDSLRGGLHRLLTRGKTLTPRLRDWYCMEVLCRDVELMHVHFGTDALYFEPLVSAADVPMMVSFHGHDAYRFPRAMGGLGGRLMRRVFRSASLITTVSDHMCYELAELGCPSHKLRTVRVGINLAKFSFAPPKPKPTTRITTVAGLRPKKGLRYLIEAFRRVWQERRDVELFIVGDGPLRGEVERQVENAGLRHAARLTGHVPLDVVADILRDTHIYAQPSVTAPDGDKEGIPATVMEAMARGIPVVATRHSGIPELVRDGVTGYLVGERDIEALTDRLLLLVENPQLWEPMGTAGREAVESRHDLVKQTAEIETIYRSLMPSADTRDFVPIGRMAPMPPSSRAV